MKTVELKPIQRNSTGCHICNRWSMFFGCSHYEPQDFTKNKPIIDAVVKSTHLDDAKIIETSDFMQGINAALIVLRQNNMIVDDVIEKINSVDFGRGSFNRDEFKARIIEHLTK